MHIPGYPGLARFAAGEPGGRSYVGGQGAEREMCVQIDSRKEEIQLVK